MTETNKYTNDYLREIIQKHFAKMNKRVTNLSSANKATLLEVIEKYNIEIPEATKEKYCIRKEGKTNVLVYNGHEYRSDDEFVYRKWQLLDGQTATVLAVIEKITPKQVHYTIKDQSYYNYKTVKKISTQDFIKIINKPKILTVLDFLKMCRSS